MNSFVDAIDESQLLTELERIGARAGRRTTQMSDLEQRIRKEGKLLNRLTEEAQAYPALKESPYYTEQVGGLRESIRGIRSKMNSLETTHITRAESEAATYISRQFGQSSLNVQAGALQRQSSVQNRAFSMSGLSYDELEARKADIYSSIRTTERGALNEVKGLFGKGGVVDPERSAALGAMMGQTHGRLQEVAMINAAQVLQRSQGQDPMARMRRIAEMGQKANQTLAAASIMEEVRQGGVTVSEGGKMRSVANADIQREIIDQSKALAQALKELSDGANKTDKELAKLRSTAEESADNIEKLQTAQGAGGGGINKAQALNAAAGAFGAIGGALQSILVGQRLGQVGNIAGFANVENQKYDMYKGARGGDVMSQMLLAQWGAAQGFGGEVRAGQQAANSAYAAGGVLQTAAGGAQVIEGLGQKANPLAYAAGTSTQNTAAIIQGAQNVVQGAATTATIGFDIGRGVSAGQAQLQAIQADMAARKALLAIPAEQLQQYRDFAVGAGAAAMGMGGGAGAFLRQTTNYGIGDEQMMRARQGLPPRQLFTERLADARLSPEQFNQMVQMGVNDIGSTFNANNVFAARGLERSGFGSMQQNMQRMATLAQAGSNNPQAGLASVLEAAVSRGLDSSKSLDLMVQNTAQIVSQNATAVSSGMDVSASAATLLAAGMDPNIANKEFALQRAMTAKEAARSIMSNTDVSFAGMVNTARISRTTGLSGEDAIYAAKLSTEQLRTMQEQMKTGNTEAVRKSLMAQGVNPNQFKGGLEKGIQGLLESSLYTLAEGGGAGFALGTSAQRQNIVAAFKDPNKAGKLSDEEKTLLGKMGYGVGISGLELLGAGQAVLNAKNDEGSGKKVSDALAGKGGDDLFRKLDDLRTSGFKQLSEQASQAQKTMQAFGGALENLVKMNKELEDFGARGGEAKFSTAAKDAADSFGKSTVLFDSSVKAFTGAVAGMISSGLGAQKVDQAVIKDLTDKLNVKGVGNR